MHQDQAGKSEGLPVIEDPRGKGGARQSSSRLTWATGRCCPSAAELHGVTLAGLYRAAQNSPASTRLIANLRLNATGQDTKMFAKGAPGARKAISLTWRKGGFLAILVDQKLNDGIEARFFGLPAMTAPAAATFALHFRLSASFPVLAKARRTRPGCASWSSSPSAHARDRNEGGRHTGPDPSHERHRGTLDTRRPCLLALAAPALALQPRSLLPGKRDQEICRSSRTVSSAVPQRQTFQRST